MRNSSIIVNVDTGTLRKFGHFGYIEEFSANCIRLFGQFVAKECISNALTNFSIHEFDFLINHAVYFYNYVMRPCLEVVLSIYRATKKLFFILDVML